VIEPWGNIACCGMAGGHGLNTTVFPMILRGVSLLGISSANCDIKMRRELWNRLGEDWKPPHLDEIITREVTLDGMEQVFDDMMEGKSLGRTVVKIGGSGD
jgi:NADPH:quinone reductase-like Zn-dependent oxidoreductase